MTWNASSGPDQPAAALTAAVAAVAGRRDGVPEELWRAVATSGGEVPHGLVVGTLAAADHEGVAVPHLLGRLYEAARTQPARRRAGVFYTPAPVAAGLAALALDGLALGGPAPLVLDPSVGAGAFLLAVAQHGRHQGASASSVVARLRGLDLDPDAVAVARVALAWWSWLCDGVATWPEPDALRVGDGLALPSEGGPPVEGVDLVIGNPPFLNQLQGATARATGQRQQARVRFGDAAKGYVDTATLFALAGLDAVRPGGRVVLIQPESMLVASHGAAARAAVMQQAALEGVWVGGSGLFDASVRVCAPVLRKTPGLDPPSRSVALWRGGGFEASGQIDVDPPERRASVAAGSWACVLASSRGVPDLRVAEAGTLAGLATATAGFRDQFYGLAPFVVEADRSREVGQPWLVTSGAISPGSCRWGQRPIRFAGRRWQAPVVDLSSLESADQVLACWVRARLRPKVLLGTQTKVLSAVDDPDATMVPSVPVISVEPLAVAPSPVSSCQPLVAIEPLWLVAAVLWSPVASVIAAWRHSGAGLSADALRLSARQVLALPVPADAEAWQDAARTYRDAVRRPPGAPPVGPSGGVHPPEPCAGEGWQVAGETMARAYGLDSAGAGAAQRWWDQQVAPSRRNARGSTAAGEPD